MRKFADLAGLRFGRFAYIEALRPTGKKATNGAMIWLCRCHAPGCGREFEVSSSVLRNNRNQSCGCQRKHLLSVAGSTGQSAIAEERRALGLTQKEFAAQIGVDRNTLGRIENGRCRPRRCRHTTRNGILKQVRDAAVREELRTAITEACGYCHRPITRKRSYAETRKRASVSGLIFCNGRCTRLYHHRGALPARVPAPGERRDLWVGMEKTLKKARGKRAAN
jgi:DNA-binding transcriptional regulator YiaG